jgi:hypothetical protein
MANSTVSAGDRASVSGAACPSCGSVNQSRFPAEMGIHFNGAKNIDKPVVWVFPEIVVCLECGTAQFAVPETELRELARGDAAAAG